MKKLYIFTYADKLNHLDKDEEAFNDKLKMDICNMTMRERYQYF